MALEFGLFIQTPVFHDPDNTEAEHESLMNDLLIAQEAERVGFKYIWVAEHHALARYSHLSSSEAVIGYLAAATERIHLGSAIWPLNPQTSSPVRRAEAGAMLDHLSHGRFEMGTGRGAGTHEIGTFNVVQDETKGNFAEILPEFKRMWGETEYQHEGEVFSTPPRNILPKPYGGGRTHPPLWMAAGNPPSWGLAAERGVGVLGFNFSTAENMTPMVQAYKSKISETTAPVGQFVNDNVMLATSLVCLPDANDARDAARQANLGLLTSLAYYYHDTFPKPEGAIVWPDTPPELTEEQIEAVAKSGVAQIGSPSEVIEALKPWEATGCDQLSFGVNWDLPIETTLEIIRTFGREVIPHFDTDPVHRSDRMRYGDRAEEIAADRTRAKRFDSTLVG